MSAFFKQPSRSRVLGTLGTLAVSALVLSACATENPSTDSSSSASASASVSASAHASSKQSSSTSPQVSEQGTASASAEASGEASPKADAEATSSDGQKLEEIYTGSEEMKNASSVPVDTEEVKKTTELVNSFENILTKVKAAPSAAPSPEKAAEPTSVGGVETIFSFSCSMYFLTEYTLILSIPETRKASLGLNLDWLRYVTTQSLDCQETLPYTACKKSERSVSLRMKRAISST